MSATTTAPMLGRDIAAARALGRRRRLVDNIIRWACLAATGIGLFFLASILFTLIIRGFAAIDLTVFTRTFEPTTYGDPEAPRGGLYHAIMGTLVQTTLGTLIGTPIGLFVGTYLAEYARGSALGNAVRFVSDVLLSAPSILVIPVVVRTTEDMLQLIPNTLREAVVGLGAPKWKMVTLVCWRSAMSGIVTGILLAIARITGETAPLLLTSFGNNITSFNLNSAMASLPIAIYQQANSGFPDLIDIAWAGALIVTFGVLAINIIARLLLGNSK